MGNGDPNKSHQGGRRSLEGQCLIVKIKILTEVSPAAGAAVFLKW